jgi:CheY-like chemotaxis protein
MAYYYVLIADDDQNYAAMLREQVSEEGYDVDVVSDVSQLAAAAARRRPDAAIVDMQMPGGGGPAAVRALRSGPGGGGIGVIVCSGMPVEQTRKWFPESARLEVFQKPPDLDALFRALAALLPAPG